MAGTSIDFKTKQMKEDSDMEEFSAMSIDEDSPQITLPQNDDCKFIKHSDSNTVYRKLLKKRTLHQEEFSQPLF